MGDTWVAVRLRRGMLWRAPREQASWARANATAEFDARQGRGGVVCTRLQQLRTQRSSDRAPASGRWCVTGSKHPSNLGILDAAMSLGRLHAMISSVSRAQVCTKVLAVQQEHEACQL